MKLKGNSTTNNCKTVLIVIVKEIFNGFIHNPTSCTHDVCVCVCVCVICSASTVTQQSKCVAALIRDQLKGGIFDSY